MMVANREESAVFVAFDTAITKLTYARATEVSNPIGYGEQDPAEYNIPYFLQDIVRKSYISSQAYRGEGNNHGDNIPGENCASCKYPVGDSFSKDTHLPEANDQTIGPASAVQEASNTYQVESNSENVDDPQDHHKEGPQSLVFTMERNRGTNVSPMHIVKWHSRMHIVKWHSRYVVPNNSYDTKSTMKLNILRL
ncbi:uncharacterized protein LOC106423345 isoform X2 [Brassica napus]|uniref:uncharacterized protein LOC106423345 isoform X2 n=1 Tax=Brassica napus TaxID=3708 RepID=UPI002078CC35|nr:uncharacterized protein LOC106423345 isoform X2 [Brassica napus]XP_048622129.1 uncharacterized protein LOC106423345 isoform X2 [Brassica napus]XP_048622134.1 uncharacterized protein LOC106423345 isoform X2 [Brassica napus]